MTEQAKVPAIRFAGFTDPWEQRKFVDFVEASGIRNKDNLQLESYSVSNDRGFVPQDEQFENGGTMRDADKTAYWIVEPGSFAYNPARINVGSIGYQSTRKNVIVSSLYEVFKTDHSCDDRFLWHWFKSSLFTKQIEMLQEGGVRLYFFFDKLQKSEIWMPNVDEQRIIGQQFDQLDSLITLHQRKYDKLVVFKKSMLEKMFPKDGESVPEIRFAGFTDPWEQRKLGEIASFSKGSGYSKADIRESGIPLFLYGRMYTQYETRVDSVDTFAAPRPGTLYSKGTEIVVPASGESAEDIARASAITREGIALGGDLNVVYPQRMVTPLFLAYGLSHGSSQKLLAQKAQGKTVVHIHASDLKGLGIAFPDVTEQQAIGTFFSSLDDLITLHQRKLELLRNIKKSLLDKMFV